jgi:hypothetical protein
VDADFTKLNLARTNKGTAQRNAAAPPRTSIDSGSGGANSNGPRIKAAMVLITIFVVIA